MPAEIESFAGFREPAWHGLGVTFDHEVYSATEMLELAGLANWNVRLVPIEIEGIPQDRWAIPYFATVRDNPVDGQPDALSIVGQRYTVSQNEELYDFGNTLGSGARWETGGSLRGGRVVFGSLAVERETVLDPTGVADTVKSFLLLSSSHDGSTAVQASITPVRVVCANTLNFALKNAKQTFKVRHTQSLEGKIAAAREALGLHNLYMDAFDVEAQALFNTPVTPSEFWDIVSAVHPEPDEDASKSAKTRHEHKIETLTDLYVSDTVAPIADTAWGALNLLTEDLDWNRGIRNDNPESKLAAASGFDPIANSKRNAIFKIVKEKVGL